MNGLSEMIPPILVKYSAKIRALSHGSFHWFSPNVGVFSKMMLFWRLASIIHGQKVAPQSIRLLLKLAFQLSPPILSMPN